VASVLIPAQQSTRCLCDRHLKRRERLPHRHVARDGIDGGVMEGEEVVTRIRPGQIGAAGVDPVHVAQAGEPAGVLDLVQLVEGEPAIPQWMPVEGFVRRWPLAHRDAVDQLDEPDLVVIGPRTSLRFVIGQERPAFTRDDRCSGAPASQGASKVATTIARSSMARLCPTRSDQAVQTRWDWEGIGPNSACLSPLDAC
jgi:hypothetical protein